MSEKLVYEVSPSVTGEDAGIVNALLHNANLNPFLKQFTEAKERLGKALETSPDCPERLAALAICVAAGERKYLSAEMLAQRAIAAAPEKACGYYALGMVNHLGSRHRQAYLNFRKARSRVGGDPVMAAELDKLERRRPPVITGLPRDHALNVHLGRLRALLSVPRNLALFVGLLLAALLALLFPMFR